jgi:hypothetical protein
MGLVSKLGIDFATRAPLDVVMDDDRRDLINHLGSELVGIMEDASAQAATLRGVPLDQLTDTIDALQLAAADAQALASAMVALADKR